MSNKKAKKKYSTLSNQSSEKINDKLLNIAFVPTKEELDLLKIMPLRISEMEEKLDKLYRRTNQKGIL